MALFPLQFQNHQNQIKKVLQLIDCARLSTMMHTMCSSEQFFKKTSAQYAFLEVVLLGFCQKGQMYKDFSQDPNELSASIPEESKDELEEVDIEDDDIESEDSMSEWAQCLKDLYALKEPLLYSVFKQAVCNDERKEKKKITLLCPKELVFFNDQIISLESIWKPVFPKKIRF